jgi:hypothetical protein
MRRQGLLRIRRRQREPRIQLPRFPLVLHRRERRRVADQTVRAMLYDIAHSAGGLGRSEVVLNFEDVVKSSFD